MMHIIAINLVLADNDILRHVESFIFSIMSFIEDIRGHISKSLNILGISAEYTHDLRKMNYDHIPKKAFNVFEHIFTAQMK